MLFIPSHLMLLREAIARVGEASVPGWSGAEMTAPLKCYDEQTLAVRIRFQTARDAVRSQLVSGKVRSEAIPEGGGQPCPIVPEHWHRPRSSEHFEDNFGTFPCWGSRSIVHVIGYATVHRADVESLLNGRRDVKEPLSLKKGSRGFVKADQALAEQILSITEAEGISDTEAARRVVERAKGGGTPESKIRRLVKQAQALRAGK